MKGTPAVIKYAIRFMPSALLLCFRRLQMNRAASIGTVIEMAHSPAWDAVDFDVECRVGWLLEDMGFQAAHGLEPVHHLINGAVPLFVFRSSRAGALRLASSARPGLVQEHLHQHETHVPIGRRGRGRADEFDGSRLALRGPAWRVSAHRATRRHSRKAEGC